jgi:hypothetical protein
VAGRTQVAEVFDSVIHAITIDVIDLEYETLATPSVSRTALATDIRDLILLECAVQQGSTGATASGSAPSKDLLGWYPVGGAAPEKVSLADKVSG